MSYQGDETIIIGTLPSDVETRGHARKLLRRHGKNDLGKNVAFDYNFDGASFDLEALTALARLPWRSGSSADFHTLVIRASEVSAAREECARVTTDLDAFASAIISAVDGDASEHDELREFLDDATALLEPRDAETPARRTAQVFAAVIRTLRRAAKHGRGIIVVHEVRGLE